jgi:hypothetical protein
MPTLLVFHEVDDVDHWLASPKREELFGPLGMTARTFRDPEGSNRVGLIVEGSGWTARWSAWGHPAERRASPTIRASLGPVPFA